jgi:Na+/proline symporter
VKLVVVLAYIALMIGIGWWSMRRTRNVGDFFIGGRTLGPWLSALAYGTTYFSAVLFVGFAGKLGWSFGTYALLIALGNSFIGVTLCWGLLAARTRDMTERLDAITMPEFLEARFGVPWFKPLGALVIFIFLVPYSASVYQGLGHLFEVNLSLTYLQAVLFMAGLTGVYLVMGGYFALAITDLVRGFMEFFGTLLLILLVAQATGHGLFGAFRAGFSPDFAPALYTPKPDALVSGGVLLASLIFMTSFGPMGLPQMVQKFYSIRSKDIIPRAMILATVFSLVISVGAYFTGAMSHHFFYAPKPAAERTTAQIAPAGPRTSVGPAGMQEQAGKMPLPTLPNGKGPDFDMVVPVMLEHYTPPWFSVIVMLIVLAASMSSLSSLVLVSSGAIVVDLLSLRDRHDKSSRKGLLPMRVLCGVFVAVSVLLAARRVEAIVTLMSMSWGALAGTFMGPYVWGTLWRRTTPTGAIAGFVLGLATAVLGFLQVGPAYAPVSASAAMLVSLISVPLVSLVTAPAAPGRLARAFGDTAPHKQEGG